MGKTRIKWEKTIPSRRDLIESIRVPGFLLRSTNCNQHSIYNGDALLPEIESFLRTGK